MSMRVEFTKEMETLHNDMIRLGSLVETALGSANQALVNYDQDLCDQVIAKDDIIDQATIQINKACVLLLSYSLRRVYEERSDSRSYRYFAWQPYPILSSGGLSF